MTLAEFDNFRADTISEYAKERVTSGDWCQTDATQRAGVVIAELLPSGLATTGHHLWSIVEPQLDRVIGAVWVQIRQRDVKLTAHVLNLVVFQQYRRKGFARRAMLLVEDILRPKGVEEITLHVLSRNESAFELYKGLGFEITNISMVKILISPKNKS